MSEYKREAISPLLRYYILNRDNFTCRYCGQVLNRRDIHIEHINPISNGGTNHRCNLAVACASCNLKKSGDVDQEVIDKEHKNNIIRELNGWGATIESIGPNEHVDLLIETVESLIDELRIDGEEDALLTAVEIACNTTNNFETRVEIMRGITVYLSCGGRL